jgi:predicted RNA-binding protein YlxR (DUF448 family)
VDLSEAIKTTAEGAPSKEERRCALHPEPARDVRQSSPEGAAEPREEGAAEPRGRERTCVGCGEHGEPGDMVRLVLGPSGEIAVDAAGGGFGRGAHVHARGSCLRQAVTRGLLRATKGQASSVHVAVKEGGDLVASEAVPLTAGALAQAIEAAMARRIAGLLGTAVRTRKLSLGADAVTGAWHRGEAALVIVATDAAAGADLGAVREAVSAGAAVSWGTKVSLAAALLRPARAEGVAVVAITDTRIADAVRDAVEKAMGARSDDGVRRSPAAGADRRAGSGAPHGAPKRGGRDKDGATSGDNRSKVSVRRAGRAPGRRVRRAQGKMAVVERSE